ncbi:MAG: quinol:electron acceptor oxidoreductase subunit ActD [Melioribacteraceae bacterium]|nr:quinol:electron acceptor oxidoreductase subunit ActD [Melioribacteraceae bacterium]
MSKKLYSYTALFDTPDDIIAAAKKVSSEGYTKYDVNTPYPVHGMDSAMKLPPSKLGFITLGAGLSGAILALLVMGWMMGIDYPIIIGGKPFFPLPAFIPITFEVTVLLATLTTVGALLFFFFKLPNNRHPLHDTDYMKSVSSDKYGICIEADDPKFNSEEVKKLFAELKATVIEPVYFDEEEVNFKTVVADKKFLAFLAGVAVFVSISAYLHLNKLLYIVPFSWMSEQEKIVVQERSDLFDDGLGMRKPVEGTIARGFLPYQFKEDPESAGKFLVNPLIPNEENLAVGKEKYNIYCSPCHGYLGMGDSRLNEQFPNPPSLHSEKSRSWTDGRIYHVIAEGQNIMPSYKNQLNRQERWAVVNYIRVLQRSLNAKETDL